MNVKPGILLLPCLCNRDRQFVIAGIRLEVQAKVEHRHPVLILILRIDQLDFGPADVEGFPAPLPCVIDKAASVPFFTVSCQALVATDVISMDMLPLTLRSVICTSSRVGILRYTTVLPPSIEN